MSKMQSPYQAFPIHSYTFQGVASSVNMDNKPNYLLHCLEDTNITIEEIGGGTIVINNLPAGMDIVLPKNTGTVTTTGTVLIS